jgi:hypothetical protein
MVSNVARTAARAYVRLPVEVKSPSGQWSGKTRDLSLGGTLVFVEPPYPQGPCSVVMDLPGGPLTVDAEVRFTIPGVGVGLQFTDLPQPAQQRIQQVVEAASATFGLWGMVGKYLGEFDSRVPLQLPSPSESVFAELRASLTRAQHNTTPPTELSHHVLHPVGENGLAYRVLFTRPGCLPPSESDLAARLTGFVRATQGRVSRVAPQDVILKLHAGSSPKPYRVAELTAGGYAAVVVSEVPGAPLRISLLTLALGEQVAVAIKGQALFPQFTDEELEQVRLDSIKATTPAPVAAPEGGGGQRARFSGFAPFDATREEELTQLLKTDAQAEVRRYGSRSVTLHPHVLLRIRDAQGVELVGVPMDDGKRQCLLQLTPDGFGRVVPLSRDHQFSILMR